MINKIKKYSLFKICETCNSLFLKATNESVINFQTKRKHCSFACRGVAQKGVPLSEDRRKKMMGRIPVNKQPPVKFNCEECSKPVERLFNRRDAERFCSLQCANDFRDEGKTSENKRIRQTNAYKAWRTLVFERDDYTCQHCEERGGQLHADHIKPFAFFPDLRFEVANGQTLCIPCHQKTPTYGGRCKKYVESMVWANQI